MRPLSIPSYILEHKHDNSYFITKLPEIAADIKNLCKGKPEVSVVIPAYNEESTILRTLSSLSKTISEKSVEIIVVNNNSKDDTQVLAERTGAVCLFEAEQGVKHARNKGLAGAKGKFIINADADTIYPPRWVDLMTEPLKDNDVACAYGRFSFFPDSGTSRLLYFFYESIGDQYKSFIQRSKEEAIYVYGCSSCYRREQGIAVDGYNHPPGAHEDGYLGLKLKQRFGKLSKVLDDKALVWTSDRRLQSEGGIFSAFKSRVKKAIKPLSL